MLQVSSNLQKRTFHDIQYMLYYNVFYLFAIIILCIYYFNVNIHKPNN